MSRRAKPRWATFCDRQCPHHHSLQPQHVVAVGFPRETSSSCEKALVERGLGRLGVFGALHQTWVSMRSMSRRAQPRWTVSVVEPCRRPTFTSCKLGHLWVLGALHQGARVVDEQARSATGATSVIEQRRLRTITSCIHSTSSPSPSYRRRRMIALSHGGQSSPSYDCMSPTITSCSHGVRHVLEVAEVVCRFRQERSYHHSCCSGRTIIAAATARRRRRLSQRNIVVQCEGLVEPTQAPLLDQKLCPLS